MHRRHLVIGALLASAVLLAGVAGAFSTGSNAATASGPEHVRIGASGQVESQPDRAVVRVAATTTAADVETARNRLAENVSSLRAALADAGVDDEQVETTEFDIRNVERFREPGRDDGEPEYRAVHEFAITLTDTARAGEIVDVAVTNGATRVDGVELTLSRERRQELRERALERAVDNARSQAETVAARADLRVTGTHSVSTTEVNTRPIRYETAAAADAGGGGTTIDTGPVTVAADVQVVYNATGR